MSDRQQAFELLEPHDILVIGSLVSDISCTYVRSSDDVTDARPEYGSSNPARITQCVGGVAHNIALAAHYLGSSVLLVSVVANDSAGQFLLREVKKEGLSTCGIMVLGNTEEHGEVRTGQYVGNYNHDKEFLFGMADVNLMLHPSIESERNWHTLLTKARPRIVVLDTSFSHSTIDIITRLASDFHVKVIVEPVSQPRARDLPLSRSFQSIGQAAPQHKVDMITPNAEELDAILQGAIRTQLVRKDVLQEAENLVRPLLSKLWQVPVAMLEELGSLLSKATVLLWYVPIMIITIGSEGVLLAMRGEDTCVTGPSSSRGASFKVDVWNEPYECHFEYYPPLFQLEGSDLLSVNGAGDSLVGAVAVEWLRALKKSGKTQAVEQGGGIPWSDWCTIIEAGQWAALATLQDESAVGPSLKNMDEFRSKLRVNRAQE